MRSCSPVSFTSFTIPHFVELLVGIYFTLFSYPSETQSLAGLLADWIFMIISLIIIAFQTLSHILSPVCPFHKLHLAFLTLSFISSFFQTYLARSILSSMEEHRLLNNSFPNNNASTLGSFLLLKLAYTLLSIYFS